MGRPPRRSLRIPADARTRVRGVLDGGRMSGHSKWSSIKHQKGAADKKRGALFSKLSRAIIVAAKEGGGDPTANLALQNAIGKARAASMPRDNIERAVARGAGAGEGGESYEAVSYEGYGSGGAALIVEGLTDNRNRTAADVRFMFGKYGGSLGAPGSVAWMFERKGLIAVPGEGVDADELTLVAADGGAEDVRESGDGGYEVIADPADLSAVREALEGAGIAFSSADLTMEPTTTVEVDVDQARSLMRLVEALEEHDDVQDVYFNFDIPDAVLQEAM
jgi:YebC/PmpR family DNA-binding regulatory protein